jgi:hypothetical protein
VAEPHLFCICCYRRYPNDQQYAHSPCCGTNLVTLDCAECGSPVEGTGKCRRCGHNQTAPRCPECGQPATNVPDDARQGRWFGSVVWNTRWNAQKDGCASCGHVFAAAIQTEAGHLVAAGPEALATQGPPSEILIRSGVSKTWTLPDRLDARPFVEVQVRRSTEGSELATAEGIRLTPEEWLAVIGQLQGPLSVLLRQKPWWEDHT